VTADRPRAPAPGTWRRSALGALRRAARLAAISAGIFVILVAGVLIGLGWVYVLRGLGWFGAGPSMRDSLPLLQLASFDGQPLERVVVAWLVAGSLVGLALARVRRGRRALIVGLGALVLLWLDSQASYALTRNVNFQATLFSRSPGLGAPVEAVCLCLSATLVPRLGRPSHVRSGALLGQLRLGAGQHRDAGEHDRDRRQMA